MPLLVDIGVPAANWEQCCGKFTACWTSSLVRDLWQRRPKAEATFAQRVR